jgi:hypothetical protein
VSKVRHTCTERHAAMASLNDLLGLDSMPKRDIALLIA